jgi:hypothetical protein
LKRYHLFIISVFIILLVISFIEIFLNDTKVIKPLSKPWEFAIPNQNIPNGLVSLSARDCGICHINHYNEWKKSTHSQAWKDLQFQAEVKKESSPFMCINCHIPLQNQQEHIITGLENGDIYKPVKVINPKFDQNLQTEGITCASCHVRNNVIIGTTGSNLAPHPVTMDPVHLSEKLCISCHNASAVITPTLACTFETGDEWKSGPFFGKKNCISCHMPEISRSVVEGFPARKSHFHAFPGAGIAKFDTLHAEKLESLHFSSSIIRKNYKCRDTIKYKFSVMNEFAGHRVPTGDPERFITIELNISNEDGISVKSKKARIGEHWQWHPKALKLDDNNLNPGETRIFSIQYLPVTKGIYHLEVKVEKHRLTPESARYNKLGPEYPLYIQVYQKIYTFKVI